MAATYISAQTFDIAGLTNVSQSITVPSDATAVYVFSTVYGGNHVLISSSSLNSVSPNASQLVQDSVGDEYVGYVLEFRSPATGSRTLAITYDQQVFEGTLCVVYVKDGSLSGWRDAKGLKYNGTTSGTITTVSGDLVLAMDTRYAGSAPSTQSGWTSIATQTSVGTTYARTQRIAASGTSTAIAIQDSSFSVFTAISIGPASSDVSVALTGLALTLSRGSLGPATAPTLTGNALTLSRGSLTPAASLALTGQALALSRGTLTSASSIALTGAGLTLAQGTLTAATGGDVTVALTGLALTMSQGSLGPSTSLALSGQALALSRGTLTPAASITLSGALLTASQGTVAPTSSVALTGQGLTAAQGTLTPALSLSLTGQGLALSGGTLTPSSSAALAGQQLTFSQGSLSAQAGGDVTVSLTGLSLSFAQGSLAPSTDKALSGATLTAAAGTLAPGTSAALSGQSLTASQGSLSAQVTGDVTVALTGLALTFAQGTISVQNDGTPPSVAGGGGGGGGGRTGINYQTSRRKLSLKERPNAHLKAILDDVGIETIYRDIVREAPKVAAELADTVEPYTDSKAAVAPADSIDWDELKKDFSALKTVFDAWLRAERQRQEEADEQWFMLGD